MGWRDRDRGASGEVAGRLTPVDIQQVKFRVAMRGYDERDVDAFLDRVTDELTTLIEEKASLAGGGSLPVPATPREVEAIIAGARSDAERAVAAAREEADRLLSEARGEAVAVVQHARADAEGTLERARAETDELMTRARADAEELMETARSRSQGTDDAAAEAERVLERARAEAAEIVRSAMDAAAAVPVGDPPAAPTTASAGDRAAVARFLQNEREFLQALGSMVQGHADDIRRMIGELRASEPPKGHAD